jgi:hypothetical protein
MGGYSWGPVTILHSAVEKMICPLKRNHNRQTVARAWEHGKHLVEIQEKEPRRQDKTSQRAQCPQSHAPARAAAKYNSTTTRPIDA